MWPSNRPPESFLWHQPWVSCVWKEVEGLPDIWLGLVARVSLAFSEVEYTLVLRRECLRLL